MKPKIHPRAVKGTAYLRKLDPEVNKLMKDHNLTREQIEDYLDHFFLTMKKFLGDPRMPKIQITNFGTFKPTIGKINFVVRLTIKFHRLGRIERDKMISTIRPLWAIKQRLIKEKAGEETWKAWRKLKM